MQNQGTQTENMYVDRPTFLALLLINIKKERNAFTRGSYRQFVQCLHQLATMNLVF